jgi:DNA repair ATPase RecN
MDELSDIIERLRACRREISEVREDNRVYWIRSTHDKLEMELYERRLERLNEIAKGLPALVPHIAA